MKPSSCFIWQSSHGNIYGVTTLYSGNTVVFHFLSSAVNKVGQQTSAKQQRNASDLKTPVIYAGKMQSETQFSTCVQLQSPKQLLIDWDLSVKKSNMQRLKPSIKKKGMYPRFKRSQLQFSPNRPRGMTSAAMLGLDSTSTT